MKNGQSGPWKVSIPDPSFSGPIPKFIIHKSFVQSLVLHQLTPVVLVWSPVILPRRKPHLDEKDSDNLFEFEV